MTGLDEELPVRVLSLWQPWAWAIFEPGVDKDVENRYWRPARPYRLLIHAGQRIDYEAVEALTQCGYAIPAELTTGAIIGRTDVLSWEWGSRSPWAAVDQWHWNLTNKVRAKTPLPCRGRQGMFFPPEDWRDSFPRPRRRTKGKD